MYINYRTGVVEHFFRRNLGQIVSYTIKTEQLKVSRQISRGLVLAMLHAENGASKNQKLEN